MLGKLARTQMIILFDFPPVSLLPKAYHIVACSVSDQRSAEATVHVIGSININQLHKHLELSDAGPQPNAHFMKPPKYQFW